MFANNPFAGLPEFFSADIMQGYIILMAILVAAGTILDMMHKKSAKYFFENAEKAKANAKRTVSGGEKVGLAVGTVASEVLTSSEFCSTKRRISHLLTMYGFILFVASSALMIFECETFAASTLATIWHVGAIMLCVGGYWFWFFIRVDVNSEGAKWYKLVRADIFIVSLFTTATFGLIWSYLQTNGGAVADMGSTTLFFALFAISNTTLFASVLWSKFAHMFFKPAAAYQKKTTVADGSKENLPQDWDLSSAEVHEKFPDIPQYMGKNPEYMGHGIRRESPNHY